MIFMDIRARASGYEVWTTTTPIPHEASPLRDDGGITTRSREGIRRSDISEDLVLGREEICNGWRMELREMPCNTDESMVWRSRLRAVMGIGMLRT